MYAAANDGRALTLSDDVVEAILAKHPGADDDAEVVTARITSADDAMDDAEDDETEGEDGGTETVTDDIAKAGVSAADQHRARAFEFAKKLDKECEGALDTAIANKEAVKMDIIFLREHLLRCFTKEELLAAPYPDTKPVDELGNKINNPDKYTAYIKVDGEWKKKPRSFWRDTFELTHIGQRLSAERALIKAGKDGKKDAPKKYVGLSDAERQSEDARYAQNETDGVGILKRAFKMILAEWSVNDNMDKVGVRLARVMRRDPKTGSPVLGADGKTPIYDVRRSPKPVIIYDKTTEGEGKAVSIGTLISFDVHRALADGGTMGDLLATAGNGAEEEHGGEGDGSLTFETFPNAAADLLNFFEKIRDSKKLIAALYKNLHKTGSETDHLLRTIFALNHELDTITSKPDLAARVAKLESGDTGSKQDAA